MARSFNGSSQHASNTGAAPASATPLTLAAWVYPTQSGVNQDLFMVYSAGDQYFGLQQLNDERLDVAVRNGGTRTSATSTGGVTINGWNHVAGVFAATNSRAAYLNGAKATNTAAVTNPTINKVTLAQVVDLNYWAGRVAHAAVWSAALTDDEVTALAKGFSPLLIRPTSLAAYWPLDGNDSPEPDRWRQGLTLTLTNSPTKADSPRIILPAPPL